MLMAFFGGLAVGGVLATLAVWVAVRAETRADEARARRRRAEAAVLEARLLAETEARVARAAEAGLIGDWSGGFGAANDDDDTVLRDVDGLLV